MALIESSILVCGSQHNTWSRMQLGAGTLPILW